MLTSKVHAVNQRNNVCSARVAIPTVRRFVLGGASGGILNSIMLIFKIPFVTTFVLVLWVTIGEDMGYAM